MNVPVNSKPLTKAFTSLDDILALERQPYEQARPFSTLDEVVDHLASFGDRVAISFMPNGDPDENTEDISFWDLHRKLIQTANAFHKLGVTAEDSVAYLLPSVPEAFFTLLSSELIGRSCPINYMLSAAAIADIVTSANAKVLVAFGPDADLGIWPKVEEIKRLAPKLQHVVVVGAEPPNRSAMRFAELVDTMPAERRFFRNGRPDAVASIYHTGGSTGAPKLVQHTHANQCHCIWLIRHYFDFSPDDVVINGHPLFHVAGALNFGIGPLAAGARLLMPSKLGLRNRTFQSAIWRTVERHRATVMIGGPTVITTLLNSDPGKHDISSMRLHISGGSQLPAELVSGMAAKFGIPVRNVWGMTETAGITCLEPARAPSIPGSCGWRVPFTEVSVFAMSGGKIQTSVECAPGEVGLLAVKGPHITPGYVDPSHNAQSFADGWFVTGDLGRIDPDGRTYLTGRAKDVIIRGGHNIDPLMIEQALLQHPDVQLCAAVGQPDSYSGEIPVAFVQLAPGSTISVDNLLNEIRSSFQEPAAIPKRLYRVDSFPMTSTGKILKPALRQKAAEAAVTEKLNSIVPSGTSLEISFQQSGHQETLHLRLPANTAPDVLGKVREAVTSLRIPVNVLLA